MTPVRNTAVRLWRMAIVGVLAVGLTAGCSSARSSARSSTYERDRLVIELTEVLREEALAIEDIARRERLVTGIIQVRDLMLGESFQKPGSAAADGSAAPEGVAMPPPDWARMFAPRSLVIGFFTQSKNFDDVSGPDGLEVRLQPLDQFGDPTKAVGSYRVEVFEYRTHTGEKRGRRLGHWFVSVLDAEANRRYYDPVDRSYVFPLLWDHDIGEDTAVIVQATYYPPGGFTHKLFAQRLIRIEATPEPEPKTEGEAGEASSDPTAR